MSRKCVVTKRGTTRGNNVAHCNKKTKRTFKVNVQKKRVWDASRNAWVTLKISPKGLRVLEKIGVDKALKMLKASGDIV